MLWCPGGLTATNARVLSEATGAVLAAATASMASQVVASAPANAPYDCEQTGEQNKR